MRDPIQVPPALHRQMLEVAKDFRKVPTLSEGMLWQALRGRQLAGLKFRRQQPFGTFVVDFICLPQRLIVEVDGSIHATQIARDAERLGLLEACGFRVLRVSAEEVEGDLAGVVARIGDACEHNLQAQG